MPQDIRKMMKEGSTSDQELREGHEERFEQLLEQRLSKQPKKTSVKMKKHIWMKIAAIFIVAGGAAMLIFNNAFENSTPSQENANPSEIVSTPVDEEVKPTDEPEILLSNISPEFKKIEDFYLASINLELARLKITDDNKELIDAFMKQLSDLDLEYKRLNKEITESGISEEMVNAMIENLKLRVALMLKLKTKLKEIREAGEETTTQQII